MSQQLITLSIVDGESSTFEVENNLNNNYERKHARVVSATVVRNWNNVGLATSIEVNATTLTIPEGYYTIASLVSWLDTAFKTVDANLSVAFDNDLNRIVVSISAGTFTLGGVGPYSRFARITGFSNLPATLVSSYTANDPPTLNNGYVGVAVENSGLSSRIYANKNQENTGFSFIIPSGSPFAIDSYNSQHFGNVLINVAGSKLRFTIRNQYNEIKMEGGEITFLIELI